MISFSVSGSTSKTDAFLKKMQDPNYLASDLSSLAQRGVAALESATPKDSGFTAASWDYEIETKGGKTTIYWINYHTEDGANIAILLQYGHGTGTGGFVSGRDYINPAIKPIFDEISSEMWRKVTQA